MITVSVSYKGGAVEVTAPDVETGKALFDEALRTAHEDLVELVVLYDGLTVLEKEFRTTSKRVAEIKALKARKQ